MNNKYFYKIVVYQFGRIINTFYFCSVILINHKMHTHQRMHYFLKATVGSDVVFSYCLSMELLPENF